VVALSQLTALDPAAVGHRFAEALTQAVTATRGLGASISPQQFQLTRSPSARGCVRRQASTLALATTFWPPTSNWQRGQVPALRVGTERARRCASAPRAMPDGAALGWPRRQR